MEPILDTPSKDALLNSLFQKAGITEEQLQDKETREFIYDFIQKEGIGIETLFGNERNPPAMHSKPPTGSKSAPPSPLIAITGVPVQDEGHIGTPKDFVHVAHVGWNPKSSFVLLTNDAQLQPLFQEVGITEKQLEDKETREFIHDFIDKHGDNETPFENEQDSPAMCPRGPPSDSRPSSLPVLTRVPAQGKLKKKCVLF